MSEGQRRLRRERFLCTLTCWAAAAFATIVAFAALVLSDAWTLLQSLFAAGVLFLGLGAVFGLLFCRPLPGPAVRPGISATPRTGATPAPAPAEPAAGAIAADESAVDDLKRIRGIGPRLEEQLNAQGITKLRQIAGWGPAEVAWWDENLEGFRGRVSRDGWVDQAKGMVAGGDAEGPRRSDGG